MTGEREMTDADDHYRPRPIAGWFMPAAIASALFMLLGCATYLMHVMADPATLPVDQRAAFAAEPLWETAAYAIAVWVGLGGSVLLIMKRRQAEATLLVALVATLAWLAGLLLVPALRDSLSTNDYAVAVVITAITWTIFWFARHSRMRGWLR